jgi:hypothetical protein
MGFMDTIKDKLDKARSKAGDYTRQHGDKVDSGVDKAARTADSKTGGKHSGRIQTGAQKAKDAARKLGDKGHGGQH